MSKVLLFDFDGTIADSLDNYLEIITKLSAKYNLPKVSREELEKLRLEEPKALIKRFKIPFYKIPFISRDMQKMQLMKITKIKPITGMPQALRNLKSLGYTPGILTSNGKENVELFLKNHNINIFNYIYSGATIFGKDKLILKFLKQNSINKENVIYVGDEIRDIQACKKTGIKIIAVTWGLNLKEGLANYHPDFLVDNPKELSKILTDKIG